MSLFTIEKIIELGGNEWEKGVMKRVYITQDLFNKITGFEVSLNKTKWKFYIDKITGDIFRTNGKKPVFAANINTLK